jgi:heptosyltransferase-2
MLCAPMAAVSDNPLPSKPPLYLKGGNILFVAPLDPVDACLAAPALRALRNGRPNATVGVLFPDYQHALWERVGKLDKLIGYPAKASARQLVPLLQLPRGEWESAFLWEPGEAAKAADRAGIAQRIGYPAKGLAKRLSEPVSIPEAPGPVAHRVRHYLMLMERLGLPGFVPESFATPGARGPETGTRLVVVPGSGFGPSHEWPVERFAAVIAELRARRPDLEILVMSEGNRPQAARALAGLVDTELFETTDLGHALDHLDRASLLFGSDSLAGHLAAHLGLPAAVVFGPNDPDWRRPLGRQNTLLRHKVECSPCLLAKCPLDLRCQLELSVTVVTEAVAAALGRVTSGG